jgi:hypothetical protein
LRYWQLSESRKKLSEEVREGFSQFVSEFIEAGMTETLFWVYFTGRQPKIVKTISAHSKSRVMILGPLKIFNS